MKILLGNHTLLKPRGSEIWTWTIAEYLKIKGHDVTILTNEAGDFATEYLSDLEIVTDVTGRKFDLGIINHSRHLNDSGAIDVEKAILVSHGRLTDIERPPLKFHCPHRHVSVSNEVRSHWLNNNKIDSEVIVNPVRKDWFEIDMSKGPLNTVVCANHRHHAPERMINAFVSRGIRFIRIETGFSQSEIMRLFSIAQLVIGTGRYIYEAMASGRRVIIADSKHGLGYVTENNYNNRVWYNMTTRNPKRIVPNWDVLIEKCLKHNPGKMRHLAMSNHHVSKIVGKFFKILNER